MTVNYAPEDLPVLFLYDMDPEWENSDRISAVESNEKMMAALKDAGHPVIPVEVQGNDLDSLLSRHAAEKPIVFNQCESIPGIPHSEHEAARIIDSHGFVYTGSTPEVLQLAGNKIETKRIIESHNIPTPASKVYYEPAAHDWNLSLYKCQDAGPWGVFHAWMVQQYLVGFLIVYPGHQNVGTPRGDAFHDAGDLSWIFALSHDYFRKSLPERPVVIHRCIFQDLIG